MKKNGSKRLCADSRALNAVTVTGAYSLARIGDTSDELQWFSALDLKSGYHQVEMTPADKNTAFSFGQGLWHLNVVPFGLCNVPNCLERLMERVLEGEQWKVELVYPDDVLVFGNTDENLIRLTEVFRHLRTAVLKLTLKKCTRTEMSFLGHLVGRQGVKTDPLKIKAVERWQVPKTVSEHRIFLGLCTYYRRFVLVFATVAAPLHNLTRKRAQYLRHEDCHQPFRGLKQAFLKAPVLPYPDHGLLYIPDTEGSQKGIVAVLS